MDDVLDITEAELLIIKQLIESAAHNGKIPAESLKAVGDLYQKVEALITNVDSIGCD